MNKAAPGAALFFTDRGVWESERKWRRDMNKAIALTCLVLLSVCACSAPVANEIDEARAIELARPHVTFEPESVEAEKAMEGGRPVWQVTFRGAAERPPLGNFMIVTIDRQTGEVVALAKS